MAWLYLGLLICTGIGMILYDYFAPYDDCRGSFNSMFSKEELIKGAWGLLCVILFLGHFAFAVLFLHNLYEMYPSLEDHGFLTCVVGILWLAIIYFPIVFGQNVADNIDLWISEAKKKRKERKEKREGKKRRD